MDTFEKYNIRGLIIFGIDILYITFALSRLGKMVCDDEFINLALFNVTRTR